MRKLLSRKVAMTRGWYSRKVFPWLLNWSMKQAALELPRQSLLEQASRNVLEIGFGTGVNLPYYPNHIGSVMAIDPNPGMLPFARSSAFSKQILVKWTIASAEQVPVTSATFDTVVSTLTLCSIPNISLAIKEIYRVLKPGGRFLFLEHGQAPDLSVRWWQDRLTPYWKLFGDGCHLNRPMAELIQIQPWVNPSIHRSYVPGIPRPFAYFYQGCLVKAVES